MGWLDGWQDQELSNAEDALKRAKGNSGSTPKQISTLQTDVDTKRVVRDNSLRAAGQKK